MLVEAHNLNNDSRDKTTNHGLFKLVRINFIWKRLVRNITMLKRVFTLTLIHCFVLNWWTARPQCYGMCIQMWCIWWNTLRKTEEAFNNEQYRDAWNIRHMTQSEDKQNKTRTHKAEKMSNTGIYQKSKGFP